MIAFDSRSVPGPQTRGTVGRPRSQVSKIGRPGHPDLENRETLRLCSVQALGTWISRGLLSPLPSFKVGYSRSPRSFGVSSSNPACRSDEEQLRVPDDLPNRRWPLRLRLELGILSQQQTNAWKWHTDSSPFLSYGRQFAGRNRGQTAKLPMHPVSRRLTA